MCSIIGSFNKDKIKELYNLNSYRGALSYSLTTFEYDNEGRLRLGVLFQDEGPMPDNLIDAHHNIEGRFVIAHSQAPTTQTKNIHPAIYGSALLWHNGIIKQKSISEGTWDTAWLLEQIINYGWSSLSRIDGTYACVMYDGANLYIFRNEISPLFVDKYLNISSTKFEGSQSLPPNKVFKIDINAQRLDVIAHFTTLENPYYIPE